jgi:protein-disulfide isomerase
VTISRRRLLAASTLALVPTGLLAVDAAAQGAFDVAELAKPGPLPEMTLGRDDAPVTVIEYASMTCSHCAHFTEAVFPRLKSAYIDTGKVRFVFREFPLDAIAAAVAMLIRNAPADKFFENLHGWFASQREWIDPKAPVDALQRFSRQFGYTEQTFRTTLSDQKLFDALSAVRKRAEEKFQVDGTPTFFVNGRKYVGIASPEELDKILADFVK